MPYEYPLYRETTYSKGRKEYQAIYWTWDEVREILGYRHDGSERADQKLIALAIKQGAMPWYATAEGWVDGEGWGLIGPEIEDDE